MYPFSFIYFFPLKKEKYHLYFFWFTKIFPCLIFYFILRHYLYDLVNAVFFLISSLFISEMIFAFIFSSFLSSAISFCTSFPEKFFRLWSYLFLWSRCMLTYCSCFHNNFWDLIAIILCNFLHEFDVNQFSGFLEGNLK